MPDDFGWPFDLGGDEALRCTLAADAGWPDRTPVADTPAHQDLAGTLARFVFVADRALAPCDAERAEGVCVNCGTPVRWRASAWRHEVGFRERDGCVEPKAAS